MAIKVIVELQAKPGRRAELEGLLESMVAKQGPSQPGFLGSTRYEVLDNPDMLIEIADLQLDQRRIGSGRRALLHVRLPSLGGLPRARRKCRRPRPVRGAAARVAALGLLPRLPSGDANAHSDSSSESRGQLLWALGFAGLGVFRASDQPVSPSRLARDSSAPSRHLT